MHTDIIDPSFTIRGSKRSRMQHLLKLKGRQAGESFLMLEGNDYEQLVYAQDLHIREQELRSNTFGIHALSVIG